MPSLTSCYFCGAAVGTSLDEYDLPEDASPDDQVTVTLCAGCKGKLTALFEQIDPADAAPEAATDDTAGDDATVASTSPPVDPVVDTDPDPDVSVEPAIDEDPDLDPVAGEQEPIFADDADAVLDEDLPGDEAAERPFASAEDGTATDDAPDQDGVDAAADHSPSGRGAAEADETASEEPADEDSAGAPPTPNAGEAPPGSETDAETDATGTGGSGTDAAEGSDDTDRDAPAVEVSTARTDTASSSTSSTSSGGSAGGPLADVSPRTYNRVVRLLQNREFPVDRADFEALATSAYELDHGECAAALDGAIEKGLLEEREGMLYRPE